MWGARGQNTSKYIFFDKILGGNLDETQVYFEIHLLVRSKKLMIYRMLILLNIFDCIDSGASSQGSNYGSGSSSDLSESEEFIIDIGNLEFRVYQGDITKANVDVIVNSTNPDFDLSKGKHKCWIKM